MRLRLRTSKKDAIFTKAFAISIGSLLGGGIALYWRETYMVDVYKKQLEELEDELGKLKQIKKEKQQQLQKSKGKQIYI